MAKKILVAGSRSYTNYEEARAYIDECLSSLGNHTIDTLLSGGCRGADCLGERYAEEQGWLVERYFPDWKRYGRGAGPKRNQDMVKAADYVICFWDGGAGTKSTIRYAQNMGKPLFIYYLSDCAEQ